MKVVVDTNVLVSGVFFGGLPARVLDAWRDGRVSLVVSPEILDEYRRVGEELACRFPPVSLGPFLGLLVTHAEIVEAPRLSKPVCSDPNDDKFFAGAVAGRCELIISGDRHLLEASGSHGVKVVTPRQFVDTLL
jgi:putative PIN family toxin of toxin-antitoxin system